MMSRQSQVKTRSQAKKKARDEFLEGLNLSQNGEYVKVDDNLLKRLKPEEKEVERPNPFVNHPEFTDALQNGTPVTLDFLNECSQIIKDDPDAVKMADMIGNIPVDWLSLKRSKMTEDNWDYSVKMSVNPKVTDQGRSGRCWAMSCYNMLRMNLMKKLNLENKFEFSEAYLFFYDKIERSNMFLEHIWSLRDRDLEDRLVRSFTNPSNHFTSDGGYFGFFVNLVNKYGLVPKNVYDEGYNSMVSDHMNDALVTVLNHMALDIFQNSDMSREDFEQYKSECMVTVYDLVVRFLGEPPKPTENFTWTYKDVHEETHVVPNLTPEKFFQMIVPHEIDTKVTLIHDPRHPETYYSSSWSPYSVNVEGGIPLNMINLPMEEIKKVVCESLKNEEAVWFACDVRRCFDGATNTFDTERFDYSAVLGTEVEFDKGDMLNMLTAAPVHAMTLIGVDTVEDNEHNVTGFKKWRVENSWGMQELMEDAMDHGYYRMSDDYFDKYVYEVVVDLKYFSQDVMSKILENAKSGNTYTYSPYDAFGTLTRLSNSNCNCSHFIKRSLKNKK